MPRVVEAHPVSHRRGSNTKPATSTTVEPPSATSEAPVTNDDSSLARNAQHAAISSGSPARRRGACSVAAA
jgi:hypothetical protein